MQETVTTRWGETFMMQETGPMSVTINLRRVSHLLFVSDSGSITLSVAANAL